MVSPMGIPLPALVALPAPLPASAVRVLSTAA